MLYGVKMSIITLRFLANRELRTFSFFSLPPSEFSSLPPPLGTGEGACGKM